MIDLEVAKIPKDLLNKVISNVEYNKIILEYYKLLASEFEDPRVYTLKNKITYIENCNKFWLVDAYHKSLVKDFKRTNLCKDKFCNNCKKVKQSARMARYMPELKQYKNTYHLTLTSPTVVGGEDLKIRVKKMSKAFRNFIRILNGTTKIIGYNFTNYGYEGAIRSLEVTFNKNIYNPHYHCLLVLNDLNMSPKVNLNPYSYSYGKLFSCFSDEEIVIQKIWYLLMNDIRVSKKNIDNLELGYSCKMDKLKPGDYNELFKYMTKEVDETGNILSYENFKDLYFALYRVKQIQGYGCLFTITDDGDYDSMLLEYEKLIEELKKIEDPEELLQSLQDLVKDETYTLISRKSYMKYLKEVLSS